MTGPVRENQLRTESKFHLAARIYRGFSPKPTPERPVVYRTVPSVTGHEPDDLIMIINKGGTAEVTNFRPNQRTRVFVPKQTATQSLINYV